MRFTVTWHPTAEAELVDVWLRATDRESVAEAANKIDQSLAVEPLNQGEDFYGDRILVVLPLAVTYTVSQPDMSVQVLQVWHQSTSSKDIG
jgi:hypothetical protein